MDYVLTIKLEVEPPVVRRVRVPEAATLGTLHDVIQIAMGWGNEHLHAFSIGKRSYDDDEDDFSLADVLKKGDKFKYEYDFGDSWRHTITVTSVGEEVPGPAFVCLSGKRACPPEDCGGASGYEDLLEVLADPAHPEYEDRLEWVEDGFDPAAFDLDDVNRRLESYGAGFRDHLRLRLLKEKSRAISGPKRGAKKPKRRR